MAEVLGKQPRPHGSRLAIVTNGGGPGALAADAIEFMLGKRIDPNFGPIILFGAGGRLVEVWSDRAIGLPPLNVTLAKRLMERTRIYVTLKGVSRPQADLAALAKLLIRFSHGATQEIKTTPYRAIGNCSRANARTRSTGQGA
jgi:hypothetical protein